MRRPLHDEVPGRLSRHDQRRSEGDMPRLISEDSDEEALVARCLQGDESAWADLFSIYHLPLLLVVSSLLKGDTRAEQAEEVTARVWCSLCSDAYARLRRYDSRKG